MKDRTPKYPGRVKLTPVSGQTNVYDMTRADSPTQDGDPINKATLLKDTTAALYDLGTDALPDDVLQVIRTLIDGRSRIEAGTYTGTGTVGSSNPNTLTFNFEPKLVAVFPSDGTAGSPTFMFCTMEEQPSWDEMCGGQRIKITFNGNTVSWYSIGHYWQATSSGIQPADASGQLNDSGKTYRYFAIG